MSFIGFEQFAATPVQSSQASTGLSQTEPIYSGGDAELAITFKKIVKKDSTTKLKGFEELQEQGSTKPLAATRLAIPHYIHCYLKVVYDRDRRVREALHRSLATLVPIVPKAFLNRLQTIFGAVWIAMSDPAAEVAAAASAAFEALAAASGLTSEAFLRKAVDDVCRHLDVVLNYTAATLVDARLGTADDSDEAYLRIIMSALNSVKRMVVQLKDAPPTLAELLEARVWTMFSNKNPTIRREAYELLGAASVHAKSIFIEPNGPGASAGVRLIAALDDMHEPNMQSLWNSALHYFSASPGAWSRSYKTICPKIFKVLRDGRVPGGCLLPLVASMSVEFTESYKKGGTGPPSARFYRDLFEAAWQGLGPIKSDETKHAVNLAALSETVLYVLLCSRSESDAVVATPELAAVALDYFIRAVNCFLTHEAGSTWAGNVVGDMSVAISKLPSAATPGRLSVATHCAELPEEVLWSTFQKALVGEAATDLGSERLISLLAAMPASESGSSQRLVRELIRLLEREALECCASPDDGRKVARNLRTIVSLAALAKDGGVFTAEYDDTGNDLAVKFVDCLSTSGNDLDAALLYARCAIDEAYIAGGTTGLKLWKKMVERCDSDLNLLEYVLRVSTPEPSLIYTTCGVFTTDDTLDAIVLSLFTGEPSTSAVTLLRLCLVSSSKSEAWPLISKSTLDALISSCCVDSKVDSIKMWRLSLLMECALSKCPYAEEAFRAASSALLQQLFTCRGISSSSILGADLWGKYAPQLLSWCDGGAALAKLEAQSLRAQLEAFFENQNGSTFESTAEHWADQVMTLAFLESETAGTVFKIVGLFDAALWERLTEDDPQVWCCLKALLNKINNARFLNALEALAESSSPLLWTMIVGASSQVTPTTSSQRQKEFLGVLAKQWSPRALDRIKHPANIDGIQTIVEALGEGSGQDYTLNALCCGATWVFENASGSSSAIFLRHAQALAGLIFALKPPREVLPCLKAGDQVYYETQQGSAQYVPATVKSISRAEEYFFTIDCDGRERETVAERLRIELPQPEESSALNTLTGLIKDCDVLLRKYSEADPSSLPAGGTDGLTLCIGILSTFLVPNTGLALSSTFLYWQNLLMSSQSATVLSLALDVLAETTEASALLENENLRKRLLERALVIGKTCTTDQPLKLIRFFVATVATHGWTIDLPPTPMLFDSLRSSTPCAQFLMVSLLRALLRSPMARGSETGQFLQQLVPIFLKCVEHSSSQTGSFSAFVVVTLLSECTEELCRLNDLSDIDDFKVNVSEYEGLFRTMMIDASDSCALGKQLSAFAVLQTAEKAIPVKPEASGGSGAAASERNSDISTEEEPAALMRRVVSLELLEALSSSADALRVGNDHGDDTVSGLSPGSLLRLLLPWCLFLDRVDLLVRSEPEKATLAGSWAKEQSALPRLMSLCAAAYDEVTNHASRSLIASGRPLLSLGSAVQEPLVDLLAGGSEPLRKFACRVLARIVLVFPGLVRHWWSNDCPRAAQPAMQNFIEKEMAPTIAQREITALRNNGTGGASADDGLTVTGSALTREITAVYAKEECNLEIVIRLPKAYPLRNVEVDCRKRLGVSESRWRRWVLQIVTLLSNQDACVQQAVDLWKKNVDREFEGLEPCPICYSILHPKNLALPSLECGTCKNKFHPECLYKWFNTSHKSKCPMCQQPFNI